MNEIQLEKIGMPITADKPDQQVNKHVQITPEKTDSVTVTNSMTRLINLLNSPVADDSAKVAAVKSQIESGSYVINTSLLAEKLYKSGVLKNVGG